LTRTPNEGIIHTSTTQPGADHAGTHRSSNGILWATTDIWRSGRHGRPRQGPLLLGAGRRGSVGSWPHVGRCAETEARLRTNQDWWGAEVVRGRLGAWGA